MESSQDSNIDDERVLELLYQHVPDEVLNEVDDLESTLTESELSAREYLVYVLAEFTDVTGTEGAELMSIREGTYWGKLGRARNKIEAAESTVVLRNPRD